MVSIDREIIAAGIIGFFLVSTAAAYIGFNDDLDVRINSVEEYRNGSEDSYETLEVNITNTGSEVIEPRIRVIPSIPSGPYLLMAKEKTLKRGETAVFNGSIDTNRRGILFGNRYQVVIEDKRTGNYFSEGFKSESRFNRNKNPFFINSKYYRFHWRGSGFGTGNYNANISGRGLNGSFSKCNTSFGCGFRYSDDYKLREKIIISGSGYRLDNETRLGVIIEDNSGKIKVPVKFMDNSVSKNFSEEIKIKQLYEKRDLEFSSSREVDYIVSFQTEKEDYHWINIENFDFVGSG